MISRDRKKERKRQNKERVDATPAMALIVSEAISPVLVENDLVERFRQIGVDPSLTRDSTDKGLYIVHQPSNREHQVSIKLGEMDDDLMQDIPSLEILMVSPIESIRGKPLAAISSQVNLSPVNDLLYMATIRAMGPISKGVMINANGETVMDDWLSWSFDYMGKTMADVQQASNNGSPDYRVVLQENPDLVYRKTWWKFWKS